MKKILFILLSLFLSKVVYSQDTSKRIELVYCFTKALILQNDSTLYNCLPSREDIKYLTVITKKYKPNSQVPTADIIISNMKRGSIKNLNRIIKKGKLMGIVWDSINVININIENIKPEFNKIEKANISIKYASGNLSFVIKITKCLKINNKWVMMDNFVLNKI